MTKLLCAVLATAMCLAAPLGAQASTKPEKLAAMTELLDKLDREDLLEGLEKANACTSKRNFACADTSLQKVKKLINGPEDKKLWEMSLSYRKAEEKRIEDEARADREREERIAAQERRAEAALQRQRQEEEARERRAQEARESAATRQGILAIVGAAAIGKATSGSNYTDAQRRALVDSYTKDRINAIDGVQTNNFGQQAETVKREVDANHRARMAALEESRRQQAEQMRAALAERRAAEARVAEARAERKPSPEKPVIVAAASPELPKYQPQTVTLPTWPQNCPPGSVPMRHPNGTPVTVAPGAVCVKDPNAANTTVASAQGQGPNTLAGKGAGGSSAGGGSAGAAAASGNAGGSVAAGTPSKTAGNVGSPGSPATKEEAPKKPEKKLFRKTPATPPPGSTAHGLTKANGEYKCDDINAYSRQYEKAADKLKDARYGADYKSEPRCQARCDLLAWREEILTTYKYRGSWSCSVPSVGLWSSVDSAGDYRSYRDGKNDDNCTCVTHNDVPITFTP